MKSILRHPAVNAVCISLFTGAYSLIFLVTSRQKEFQEMLYYSQKATENSCSFWTAWSTFLAAGHQVYIVYALIAITLLTIVLLSLRRRPYDEYHASILIQCLAVAAVLTLIAIGIFYLLILSDPNGIVEKFTLFIVIHWVTVVFSDFVYVLLCRWR